MDILWLFGPSCGESEGAGLGQQPGAEVPSLGGLVPAEVWEAVQVWAEEPELASLASMALKVYTLLVF